MLKIKFIRNSLILFFISFPLISVHAVTENSACGKLSGYGRLDCLDENANCRIIIGSDSTNSIVFILKNDDHLFRAWNNSQISFEITVDSLNQTIPRAVLNQTPTRMGSDTHHQLNLKETRGCI